MDSVRRQPTERRLDDCRNDGLPQSTRQQFIRRVRAHASRVRALVSVKNPLVIARRHERRVALAIGKDDEGQFVAFQRLLQQDSLSAGPSSFFSITRATKSLAASRSGARKTPLPAHSPSALITTGQVTAGNTS